MVTLGAVHHGAALLTLVVAAVAAVLARAIAGRRGLGGTALGAGHVWCLVN